jgi:hypothetical protein
MSRPGAAAALVVVAVAATVVALTHPEPLAAGPPPCHHDYCTEDDLTLPGETAPTPATPVADDGQAAPTGDGPADRPGPRCTWVSDPGPLPGSDGAPGAFPDVGPRRAPDDYLIFEQCDGELTGRVQWASPADPVPGGGPATPAAAAPTPAQLAATIRVRLEGDLPQPIAVTSPPAGDPAVVNHPTFLAIDNWTGTVTDRECAFLLCVTVTATPQLTWSPGEPNAPTFNCAGSGTRFDPTGSSPQDQAAQPQACAHAFRARTGTTGRPDEWPGTATVTWTLIWTSTSGAGGDLPPITRSTDVPRAVDEVQAIVVR